MERHKSITFKTDGKSITLAYINNSYGYLHAIFNYEDLHVLRNGKLHGYPKILILGSLFINERFRGQGIGSLLLSTLIKYACENAVIKIILDDMSDNCRQKHNIYIKNGFRYVHDYGPEMELTLIPDFDFELSKI
jgi:GNAT superfamily N-acetyltransferase